MDFFSKDNILVFATDEVKKSKKGDGINAILSFLVDLRIFRDRIDACAESQDITENRQKIEAIGSDLDKHLNELIDVVKGGISAIRKSPVAVEGSEGALEPASPALPSTPTPIK